MNRKYLAQVNYHLRRNSIAQEWQSFLIRTSGWLLGFFLMFLPVITIGLVGSYYLEIILLLPLIIFFSLMMLVRNIAMARGKGLALALDRNQMGLWLKSPRCRQLLYVPFTLLTLVEFRHHQLVIHFRQAFIVDTEGNPRAVGGGRVKYRDWLLDGELLRKFIAEYNGQVSARQQVQTTAADWRDAPVKIVAWACVFLVIVAGEAGYVKKSTPSNNVLSIAANTINNQKTEGTLKVGKSYQSSYYNFKVKKAYLAQDKYKHKIAIFQVERTKRGHRELSDYPSITSDDFAVTRSRRGLADTINSAKSLNSASVMVGGQEKPVINLLHQETDVADDHQVTFNLAYRLPKRVKQNFYFAYLPYQIGDKPTSLEDNIQLILKVPVKSLEELR